MKYEALFEDEDNIFGGTPLSKWMDIINVANKNLVEQELERVYIRHAVMEKLLLEKMSEEELDREVYNYQHVKYDEIESDVKSLYLESTGNVVTRNE
ncbi:MAG: DUF2018 family protein [Helicobacteraceae bacterium]|nr:DUF2018 family protein [Helicobacteraceae bacterium]